MSDSGEKLSTADQKVPEKVTPEQIPWVQWMKVAGVAVALLVGLNQLVCKPTTVPVPDGAPSGILGSGIAGEPVKRANRAEYKDGMVLESVGSSIDVSLESGDPLGVTTDPGPDGGYLRQKEGIYQITVTNNRQKAVPEYGIELNRYLDGTKLAQQGFVVRHLPAGRSVQLNLHVGPYSKVVTNTERVRL